MAQDPDDDGKLVMEDVDPIPMASGANLGRGNYLRPPAVVTEFMSQGSVKQALARKSEVVHGNMHRVVVAMDAAKVGGPPYTPWSHPCMSELCVHGCSSHQYLQKKFCQGSGARQHLC